MKRFSKDVYHLMVLLPIFGSWPLYLFYSYFSISDFYTSLINCLLIGFVGFGACGVFVSRGKGYLWKDYLFILFVCMAVLGSIFSNFFRAITELITTIGIFGIIVRSWEILIIKIQRRAKKRRRKTGGIILILPV